MCMNQGIRFVQHLRLCFLVLTDCIFQFVLNATGILGRFLRL